jgi:uncharacterized membrane protein YeaQ/YmgE (transglycosylase-associated protein family)
MTKWMTTDAHEEMPMNLVFQIITLGLQIYPTPIPTFVPIASPIVAQVDPVATPNPFVQSPLDQTIRVEFTVGAAVTAILIGIVAGFLASLLVRGRSSNVASSMVIGLLGALVGNFLFGLLNVPISPSLLDGITLRWIDILVSFVGAVIVLVIFAPLAGRRRG